MENVSASQTPTVEAVEAVEVTVEAVLSSSALDYQHVPKMMAAQPPPHTKDQHEVFMECLEFFGLHALPKQDFADHQQERINKAQCRTLM